MEDAVIGDTPYPFDGEGDNVVAAGFPKWEISGTPDQVRGDETRLRGDEASDSPLPVTPASEPGSRSTMGKVFINPTQYFDAVPEIAWGFPIGGYTPAQKWLKDRRGRTLGWDDIRHYQKIIRILTETDRIMRKIELPLD